MNLAPLLRNLARYSLGTALGVLVTRGYISQDLADTLANDPEVLAAIQYGSVAAGIWITEMLYAFAKQRGWAT